MRRLSLWLLPIVVLALPACSDDVNPTAPGAPEFGVVSDAPLTVMSRNLYLGANIDMLLDPSIPFDQAVAASLQQLTYTNYPVRAQQLALEIATRQPHLVGLQEVTHYTIHTAGGPVQIPFLPILQQYLAAMGAHYDVAVHQTNVELTFPVGAGGIVAVTYRDGDAILVRSDVAWSDPAAAHFTNQVQLAVGPISFANLRGWNAVTAEVDGYSVRFVNTHLEIQPFRPYNEAQARELVALVADEPLPVIMVGDFNSAANHDAPADKKTASYHTFRNAGFADLWLREAGSVGGTTCCHAADLSNAESALNQRIDLVLVRLKSAGFGGRSNVEIIGEDPSDRFDAGGYMLWPSDHAGVFASMWVAPGLRR
jgi:endonuclease/exonuclease/phosphatase family metal-dependent hydrolase